MSDSVLRFDDLVRVVPETSHNDVPPIKIPRGPRVQNVSGTTEQDDDWGGFLDAIPEDDDEFAPPSHRDMPARMSMDVLPDDPGIDNLEWSQPRTPKNATKYTAVSGNRCSRHAIADDFDSSDTLDLSNQDYEDLMSLRRGHKSSFSSNGQPKRPWNKLWLFAICGVIVVGLVGVAAITAFANKGNVLPAGVYARWTYDGQTHDVTYKDLVSAGVVLEPESSFKLTDELLTSYIEFELVQQEAEDAGITVTDKEVDTYASKIFGSDDYEAQAVPDVDLTADMVKDLARQQLISWRYRAKKFGFQDILTAYPSLPPSTGDASTYGSYIVKTFGSEWNGETNSLIEGGGFATRLTDFTFDPSTATAVQAQEVYQAAIEIWQEANKAPTKKWDSYLKGLMDKVEIVTQSDSSK